MNDLSNLIGKNIVISSFRESNACNVIDDILIISYIFMNKKFNDIEMRLYSLNSHSFVNLYFSNLEFNTLCVSERCRLYTLNVELI